jgi:hypothetical protein
MLWACVKCTARRAAGMLHCPQCGEAEYQDAPGGDVEPGAPVLNAVKSAADESVAVKPKPAKKSVPDAPVAPAPAAGPAAS